MTPYTKAVLDYVCDHHGVTRDSIMDRYGKSDVRIARMEAMTLLRFAKYSYPRIGQIFDGRDHGTVLLSVRKIRDKYPARYRQLEGKAKQLMAEFGVTKADRALNRGVIDKSEKPRRDAEAVELDFLRRANTSLRYEVARLTRKTARLESSLQHFDRAYGALELVKRLGYLEEENRWLRERVPECRQVAGSA